MKKYLFLALGVAALTSCSSDEVTELNQGNEIKFSVVADNDSRAATVFCNNNLMSSFYVYANDGTNAFINADLIESTDGVNWNNTTATKRYWPETGTLDFYAIVNGYENTIVDTKATPSIDNFTVGTNVATQKDLMYAVTTDQGRNVNSGIVALNFRHALSQIEFQAKNTNEFISVEITDVVVGNAASVGDFALPVASTSDKFGEHNNGVTTVDATITNQGTWSNIGTPANYLVATNATGHIAGNSSIVNLTCATGVDAPEKVWSKTMLLLPQENTTAWVTTAPVTPEGAATTGTYLGVKCKIYNVTEVDGSPVETQIYGGTDGAWALLPVQFNWKQGKKYVYTFVFSTGNGGYQPDGEDVLDDIQLSVTVDDFILGQQPGDVEMETE